MGSSWFEALQNRPPWSGITMSSPFMGGISMDRIPADEISAQG